MQLVRPSVVAALVLQTGCFLEDVTAAEMRMAIEESVESGQVQQLENGVIEITTDFTIGDAVEEVRQQIAEVLAACGNISVEAVDDVTIVIDFGPASDPCAHEGKLYSGQVELDITWGSDRIDVAHHYTDLSDGTFVLNGTKDVGWTAGEGATVERQISSDVGWDGPRGHVDHQSERTMTFFDWLGGPTQRIGIDGDHDWQRDGDDWHLDVDEVELRLVDPVPQAGSYTLVLPSGKDVSMGFARVDDDTIEVTVSGGRREHVFHVTSAGGVSEEG